MEIGKHTFSTSLRSNSFRMAPENSSFLGGIHTVQVVTEEYLNMATMSPNLHNKKKNNKTKNRCMTSKAITLPTT